MVGRVSVGSLFFAIQGTDSFIKVKKEAAQKLQPS
jgi:hypothetical protein